MVWKLSKPMLYIRNVTDTNTSMNLVIEYYSCVVCVWGGFSESFQSIWLRLTVCRGIYLYPSVSTWSSKD